MPRWSAPWPRTLLFAYVGAMVLTLGIIVGLFGPPGAWPSGIIYGQVVLREGDCMPVVEPGTCWIGLVSRTIYIRGPASLGMMEGTYLRVKTPLVATTEARQGLFEVSLPIGLYSVFVEDEGGEYCNRWDSQIVCGVWVGRGAAVQYNITINHATD